MTGLLFGPEITVSLFRFTIQFTFTRNKTLPSFQPYIGSPSFYLVNSRYAVDLLLDCNTKFVG